MALAPGFQSVTAPLAMTIAARLRRRVAEMLANDPPAKTVVPSATMVETVEYAPGSHGVGAPEAESIAAMWSRDCPADRAELPPRIDRRARRDEGPHRTRRDIRIPRFERAGREVERRDAGAEAPATVEKRPPA
jgi:hypothetical protein